MSTTNQITKRKVTMSRPRPIWNDEKGRWDAMPDATVVDYVPDDDRDVLAAYVADAEKRWALVEVGEDFDAGEGGYDGQTYIPHTLDHDLAGTTFPETGVTSQQQQAQFATTALRNARVVGGTATMTHVALQSTAAAATAGTEISGGSPAYARKPTSWSAVSNGSQATTQTHDVPSGANVQSIALMTALTGGSMQSAVDVTPQPFASQGQYTSTVSDTQS